MCKKERERVERIAGKEIPRIKYEESLLSKFQQVLQRLIKPQAHSIRETVEALFLPDSEVPSPVLKAFGEVIKNRWALWLDSQQLDLDLMVGIEREKVRRKIEASFSSFVAKVEQNFRRNMFELCESSSEHLRIAQAYEDAKELPTAIFYLQRGLGKEATYNEVCHYYLASCILKRDGENLQSRRWAREHWKIAEKKIKERIESLQEFISWHAVVIQLGQSEDEEQESARLANNQEQTVRNQVDNEIQLYNIHLREMLTPAIGHSLEKHSFVNLKAVNKDEEESEKILDALITHTQSGTLKPLRVSKKVRVDCSDESLLFENQPLISALSDQHSIYAAKISKLLKQAMEKCGREVKISDFAKLAMSKEEFWRLVESAGILEDISSYKQIQISYDSDSFMENFELPIEQKIVIGRILDANNGKEFVPAIFEGSNFAKNIQHLQEKLLADGHLKEHNFHKGTLKMTTELIWGDKQLRGLPTSLIPYEAQIRTWIVQCGADIQFTQALGGTILDTKNLLFSSESKEEEGTEVLDDLMRKGIIKQVKVNWSISTSLGDPQKRKKCITNQLKDKSEVSKPPKLVQALWSIFVKYHPKNDGQPEFKSYLKEIRKELIKSVGTLKTLEKIKVKKDYEQLVDCFPGSSPPIEIHEFINDHFHRIPKLGESIPWWMSGAFWVSVLGLVQIAAGVAVGVLSAGTLANVSMMLISEGGSDLMFAMQAGMTGTFSWKSYGIHKAFSVAASILTGGLGGISGASMGSIILMEVAEEIIKKVVWTVGRYVVQGIGTTLLGMGIEKALDLLREKILSKADVALRMFFTSNENYARKKVELGETLNKLYTSSYRTGQAENFMLHAQTELGIKDPNSALNDAFATAVKRVASFYMSKITEKLTNALGKGFVNNAIKLLKFLGSSSSIIDKAVDTVKEFANRYLSRLIAYFQKEAENLEAKAEARALGDRKGQEGHEQKFQVFVNSYLNQTDEDVVKLAMDKLQHEFAEPALKKWGNRLIESGCQRIGSKRQANYPSHYSDSRDTFWKQMSRPSAHYSAEINTRFLGKEGQVRNNIWEAESFDKIARFVVPVESGSGGMLPIFISSEESREYEHLAVDNDLIVVPEF